MLAGERPQNTEFAPTYRLLLNRRSARKLGLDIPADLLEKAEEVVK